MYDVRILSMAEKSNFITSLQGTDTLEEAGVSLIPSLIPINAFMNEGLEQNARH